LRSPRSAANSRVADIQIARLDQVFKKLGQQPQGVNCPAIDGLISEADEVAGEVADKQVLDAAIVGAAQSVEHYEIARYGTLIAWADALGHDDVVRLLVPGPRASLASRNDGAKR
jgi:ferritin-like metal-binding protein YciE